MGGPGGMGGGGAPSASAGWQTKKDAVKKCIGCDGRGVKTMLRQMGPMMQRFQIVCPDCGGEGE